MKKYLAILGLVFVTVVWGGGFVASDMALGSLTPFQIMIIRFGIGTVLMGLISYRHLKGITGGELCAGILLGFALFMGFACQIVGLQYTKKKKNAFLTATNVVMVPFIAFVIYKKKVSKRGIIGAFMAIIGVGILSLDRNLSFGFGDALTLVCAVGFAFQIFLTGEFVSKYRATVLNFIQMATSFVLSAVILIVLGQWNISATTQGWLSVLYLGVVSTTLTYLLQTSCQKYVDETKAAIILSMESVFGTLFSIMILHETVTAKMMVGCILIFAAVILANSAPEETAQTDAVCE